MAPVASTISAAGAATTLSTHPQGRMTAQARTAASKMTASVSANAALRARLLLDVACGT
jgi:hypothetical protein